MGGPRDESYARIQELKQVVDELREELSSREEELENEIAALDSSLTRIAQYVANQQYRHQVLGLEYDTEAILTTIGDMTK